MITASQLRAARALLGIDQPALARRAGLSLPTIQRMETSDGLIRGNVDSLTKVVQALEDMGVALIGEPRSLPLVGKIGRFGTCAQRSMSSQAGACGLNDSDGSYLGWDELKLKL